MVAWLIWATTAIGGDTEPWVRLSSPLIHALTTLCVYGIGRRLYGSSTGFTAAALYLLMPAVQLSSLVIATDAPMLLFLASPCWPMWSCWRRRPAARSAVLGLGAALAWPSSRNMRRSMD
jgi:4-amino-4-deoxy-L-arabinose transferase-like glycosyltransferase